MFYWVTNSNNPSTDTTTVLHFTILLEIQYFTAGIYVCSCVSDDSISNTRVKDVGVGYEDGE